MARKSYKPEEIIKLLRVVEIEAGKGQTTGLDCKTLGHHRSTQRLVCVMREDESVLTKAIIDLATDYGRYGYRRVTAL